MPIPIITVSTATQRPAGIAVSLQYFPENLGGFVRYRVADAMDTPLADELRAIAGGNPLDNFKVQGLPDVSQIKSITMGMNRVDLSSGFNRMRNRSMSDGLIVVRLTTSFDPTSHGTNGEDHGGQTIYRTGAMSMWCPDATTIVAGPRTQVTEAIDRGGQEFRFRHFDFANVGHHVTMVVAENATRGTDKSPGRPSGMAALDTLATSANKNLQGVCLGLSLSTGVDADVQLLCFGSSEATALKGDIDSGISQLKQLVSSNPMLAQVASLANELFDRLQTTQSGRSIHMSLSIDKSMIDRIKQMARGPIR